MKEAFVKHRLFEVAMLLVVILTPTEVLSAEESARSNLLIMIAEPLLQYTDITPAFIEIAGGDPTKTNTGCPDAHGKRSFDGKSFLSILRGEDK